MRSHGRIGFVTYPGSRWRQYLLRAKYFKMRLERNIYPDVYALPLFLTEHFDLVPMGAEVRPGDYDLLFSELNGTQEQIAYLHGLVRKSGASVAVIPGPPEILSRVLTNDKVLLIRDILRECRYLFVYSEDIAAFFDGLAGAPRSLVIPWPFDYARTRTLGESRNSMKNDSIRVLFNVPLRLSGPASTSPLAMKAVFQDVLQRLSASERARITFHTFAYAAEDSEEYVRRGVGDAFPIRLERKRGYASFLRFVGNCSAIVNYTPNGILGRLAFATAALGVPGIFSQNVPLHRELYPQSSFPPFDLMRLSKAATALIAGMLHNDIPEAFMPDASATRRIGDFAANASRFRLLLEPTRRFAPSPNPSS